MSHKESPSYAALGNAHSKTRLSLYEKFAMWFRDFLENAE